MKFTSFLILLAANRILPAIGSDDAPDPNEQTRLAAMLRSYLPNSEHRHAADIIRTAYTPNDPDSPATGDVPPGPSQGRYTMPQVRQLQLNLNRIAARQPEDADRPEGSSVPGRNYTFGEVRDLQDRLNNIHARAASTPKRLINENEDRSLGALLTGGISEIKGDLGDAFHSVKGDLQEGKERLRGALNEEFGEKATSKAISGLKRLKNYMLGKTNYKEGLKKLRERLGDVSSEEKKKTHLKDLIPSFRKLIARKPKPNRAEAWHYLESRKEVFYLLANKFNLDMEKDEEEFNKIASDLLDCYSILPLRYGFGYTIEPIEPIDAILRIDFLRHGTDNLEEGNSANLAYFLTDLYRALNSNYCRKKFSNKERYGIRVSNVFEAAKELAVGSLSRNHAEYKPKTIYNLWRFHDIGLKELKSVAKSSSKIEAMADALYRFALSDVDIIEALNKNRSPSISKASEIVDYVTNTINALTSVQYPESASLLGRVVAMAMGKISALDEKPVLIGVPCSGKFLKEKEFYVYKYHTEGEMTLDSSLAYYYPRSWASLRPELCVTVAEYKKCTGFKILRPFTKVPESKCTFIKENQTNFMKVDGLYGKDFIACHKRETLCSDVAQPAKRYATRYFKPQILTLVKAFIAEFYYSHW